MACQFALDFALQRRKTVYVTTEMKPPSLVARMASNYLKADYGLFTQRAEVQNKIVEGQVAETKEVSAMPDSMWKDKNHGPALLKLDAALTENLVFLDWSGGAGKSAVQHLDGEIDKIIAGGFIPEAVIFDWIGGGLDHSDKNLELREVYKNTAEHLINYAKRQSCIMIMFAQLDKVLAMGKQKCGFRMVSECKSMADNVWNYIGISAILDQSNGGIYETNQWLYIEKCRDGKGGLVAVERHFHLQKFMSKNTTGSIQGGSAGDNTVAGGG